LSLQTGPAGDLINRPTPSGQIGEEMGVRPGRKRGAETRSARLLHSYVALKRGVCFPKTLTDRVPKVPKGYFEGFWHYWHLLKLGISTVTLPGEDAAEGNPTQERRWLAVLKSLEF
jgi:hypothetical protein